MRLRTFAGGVSALAVVASLAVPAAAVPGVAPVRLGVVTYAGERIAGGLGCKYTGSETVAPGSIPAGMALDEREIGHDLATCTLTMRRSLVPVPGGRASAQVSRLLAAFHKTYHEDPPGIDVTSLQVEVAWMADDICVSYYSSQHDSAADYFEYSGWAQDSGSSGTYRDCSGASTSASAKFSNDLFCRALVGILAGSTFTEYDPTFIKGRVDGQYYVEWAAYKWGGCTDLLTFGHTHGFQNYNDV